jgi:hypothetical protein
MPVCRTAHRPTAYGHTAYGHTAYGHTAYGHTAYGHTAYGHTAYGHTAMTCRSGGSREQQRCSNAARAVTSPLHPLPVSQSR